jgi:hypothetical protein
VLTFFGTSIISIVLVIGVYIYHRKNRQGKALDVADF